MEPIFALTPDQFRAALAELGLDAEREADLIRQYNEINGPQEGAGRRGMIYNLLDNIIGYDDDIVTPGERLGAGVQGFASGLLSDPLGTGADIVRGGYETIERAMAPGATPMDVLGAAGMAMGAGGMAAAPRGALRAFALRGGGQSDPTELGWNFRDVRRLDMGPENWRRFNNFEIAPREEVLPIRSMYATQERVNPDFATTSSSAGELPTVVRYGGEYYVTDGHHRLTRVAEQGGQNARVNLYDMDRTGRSDTPLLDFNPERYARDQAEMDAILDELGDLDELIAASETPAQQVARLLREGRADEVTDDLMAQADPQEMFRLYDAGETGADMPMDEASRMARAQEMGLTFDTFHGTPAVENISALRASRSGEIGPGVYHTRSPEYAGEYARRFDAEGDLVGIGQVMPLRTAEPTIMPRRDWVSQSGSEMDAIRSERGGEWSSDIPEIANQRMVSRTGGNVYFDGAARFDNQGVTFDPRNIRSRFARFDPRLSHLANLNAANIDPLTGAVAMGASQQQNTDPLANLRAYIAQYGGVLGR